LMVRIIRLVQLFSFGSGCFAPPPLKNLLF
jgi:hypothetical protein